MPSDTTQYDAIIIGSGQGGSPLAVKLAGRGEKVALVESNHLGGTCVNTGCTPTKTMIGSAQIAHYARNASRWGVRANNISVDLPSIVKRKDEVVHEFRSGWEKSVDREGKPRWYRSRARFVGPKQLQVGDAVLGGNRIFIDTGVRPAIPKIAGLDAIPYLTNVSLLELTEVPEHLVVLGGGYVGLEFAQMFRRFSSEVTVIQRGPRLLMREDDDIAAAMADILREDGIEVLLETAALRAEPGKD